MANGGVPTVDFSPIGDLANVYESARLKANRQRILEQAAGQGGDLDLGKLSTALIGGGDVEGAMSLAKLKMAQQQADPAYQAQLIRQKYELENKYQPQIGQTHDQYGNPTGYIRDATGQPRALGTLPGTAPPDPNVPPPPPGVNPVEWTKRSTDAQIKEQSQRVQDAKTAADVEPLITRAKEAYQKVMAAGGVGPVVASDIMRKNMKYNPLMPQGSKDLEAAREDYERAVNTLQLRVNVFKGQGAVSDYERRLGSMQFPSLTAVDPNSQFDYLDQMHAATRQTIEQGKASPLNRGAILDRPQIGGATAPPTVKPPTQAELDFAKQNRDAVLQNAREAIKGKTSRAAVEQKLRTLGIDPKDL